MVDTDPQQIQTMIFALLASNCWIAEKHQSLGEAQEEMKGATSLSFNYTFTLYSLTAGTAKKSARKLDQ